MPEQLLELYRNEQYDQIIADGENTDRRVQFNEWDFSYYMNSLYKRNRYEDCLLVYKEFHKKFPESDRLDDKMGWAIYYVRIKPFDFEKGNRDRLIEQVNYVMTHSSNTQYSPRWRVAKLILDAIKEGKLGTEFDYHQSNYYLDFFDPMTLSAEERTIAQNDGKERRVASDQECWFSHKTRTLLKLKEYQKCIECCEQALHAIQIFHSNNDSWFYYRKATSLRELGRVEEAKQMIERILTNGFSHWCLNRFLFENARSLDNRDEALKQGAICALADLEHKMRVTFYQEYADFLDTCGMADEATLHRRLVVLLRQENDWKLKSYQAEWEFEERIENMDKGAVLKQLRPFWIEQRDKNKVFMTGSIIRLLGEGKSGFIRADNGEEYYFNVRDILGKCNSINVGQRVKFTLMDKLDKKKNEIKKNAVEIVFID